MTKAEDHFLLNTPRGRRFFELAGHDEPPVLGSGDGPAPMPARWCNARHCSPEKGCDTTREAMAVEIAALRDALKDAESVADKLRSDIEQRHGHDGSSDAACEICDELAAMKAQHEAALGIEQAHNRILAKNVATAEQAELAAMKAQKPVAWWWIEDGVMHEKSTVRTTHGSKPDRSCNPLYASPVPQPANDRLEEALRSIEALMAGIIKRNQGGYVGDRMDVNTALGIARDALKIEDKGVA